MGRNGSGRLWVAAGCVLVVAMAMAVGARLYDRGRLEATEARFAAEFGPLDPAAYDRPPVPDAENAAHWLRRGVAALELREEERSDFRWAVWKPGEELADWERDLLTTVVRRNRGALELLHRAAECQASDWGWPATGDGVAFSGLIPVLHAGQTLLAEARLALLAGDVGAALRATRALGRLAESLYLEPHVAAGLVAVSLDRQQLAATEALFLDAAVHPILLQATEELLERGLPPVSAEEMVRVEAIETEALLAAMPQPRYGTEAARVGSLRRWMGVLEAVRRPYPELRARLLAQLRQGSGVPRLLPRLARPNVLRIAGRAKLAQAVRRLALLAVRVERLRRSQGRRPTPAAIRSLAPEPLDPFAGGPLFLETAEDGSMTLALPDAERWRAAVEQADVVQPARLRWILPPPGI